LAQFATGPIDFELGNRLFALRRPAENILAAAIGMPEDFINLCFPGRIELTDGECGVGTGGGAPIRFRRRIAQAPERQLVP